MEKKFEFEASLYFFRAVKASDEHLKTIFEKDSGKSGITTDVIRGTVH
jgi:hypothetical protein